MKKSLFFVAAASALMLTACSSESDVVQTATQPQTTVQNQAVGFDVYTPAATDVTRAGQAGTMTTGRLQRTPANDGGFGVYAYLVEDVDGAATATDYVNWQNRSEPSKAPNFMVNQLVEWNSTNQGWAYDPLKYWPNETDNDSQKSPAEMEGISGTKHLDRLTFFAYAPYVTAGVDQPGITLLTNKKGVLVADPTTSTTGTLVEASVGYKAALDAPSSSVDLLWGVAPSGGLNYTAVNGQTVKVEEGEPLIDMTKPNVNTSMKFLFNHALARIGINVVAAIDQVGAGGKLDGATKITVKEVTLTGKFGETGVLNLDNPNAKVAHWVDINGIPITGSTTSLATDRTLTLSVASNTIAPDLRYAGDHTTPYSEQTVSGVTTSKKDLIAPRYFKLDAAPTYDPAKKYYSDLNGTEKLAQHNATPEQNIFTKASGPVPVYTQQNGYINAPAWPNTTTDYYTVVVDKSFAGNHENGTYTQAECDTHNAGIDGALPSTPTALTTTQADTYNATLTGAITSGTELTADQITLVNGALSTSYSTGDHISPTDAANYNKTLTGSVDNNGMGTLTADQANAYNGKLPGAWTTATVKYGVSDSELSSGKKLFTRTGGAGSYVYTSAGNKGSITWGADQSDKTYYTLTVGPQLSVTDDPLEFKYNGDTYDTERNYFMVVPTNNVYRKTVADSDEDKALRTIRVKIEYYVTTEDPKVDGGRTEIKNVIEKDVLFPSLANGKSYMLNLVLGLTSVKMDAEVDDWKVINVNADLPQNTDN